MSWQDLRSPQSLNQGSFRPAGHITVYKLAISPAGSTGIGVQAPHFPAPSRGSYPVRAGNLCLGARGLSPSESRARVDRERTPPKVALRTAPYLLHPNPRTTTYCHSELGWVLVLGGRESEYKVSQNCAPCLLGAAGTSSSQTGRWWRVSAASLRSAGGACKSVSLMSSLR